MTLVAVATVTALAFRIWRLLAHDRLTQPLRDKWLGGNPDGMVNYFMGCPWCLGTWLSVALTGLWAATHPFTAWDFAGVAGASSVLVGWAGDR